MERQRKPGWRLGGMGALLMLAAAPWLIAVGPPGGEVLPDAGLQRREIIAGLQKANEQSAVTNRLLTEIRDLLKTALGKKAAPAGDDGGS